MIMQLMDYFFDTKLFVTVLPLLTGINSMMTPDERQRKSDSINIQVDKTD